MRDYAAHYSVPKKRHQPTTSWRGHSRAQTKGSKAFFLRVLGGMLVCAMISGIISSFWVGHCIQKSLSGIAHAQELQGHEQKVKADLLKEKELILAGKKFEAMAAVQVGLFSPERQQEIGFR